MKKILFTIILLSFALFNIDNTVSAATASAPVKKVSTNLPINSTVKSPIKALSVSPLDIVNNPTGYLNKVVSFSGEFVSFTSLGLDYKPAFRDSSKYIGILIKRPDVKEHTIPLSELKMFMTREIAEKNIDIETGDKFTLTGKVFSTALGDPWMDITEFRITDKKIKNNIKK